MRIVDRHELMRLPAGTLYTELNGPDHAYAEGLSIKAETISHNGKNIDWVCQSLTDPSFVGMVDSGDHVEGWDALWRGEEREADLDYYGRDGCFDDNARYLAWSEADKQKLVKCLTPTKEG